MDKDKKPINIQRSQAWHDDFTNYGLRIGVFRMNKDGTMDWTSKGRTYSAAELARARELTKARNFLRRKKEEELLQAARDAGWNGSAIPDAED